MKSARADALRLILPFLPRLATVDFFGIDDFRVSSTGFLLLMMCFSMRIETRTIATARVLLGHDCQWQKKHGGRECDSYAPEHKQPPVDAAIIGGQVA